MITSALVSHTWNARQHGARRPQFVECQSTGSLEKRGRNWTMSRFAIGITPIGIYEDLKNVNAQNNPLVTVKSHLFNPTLKSLPQISVLKSS
jgi:hypothetical protein